jgi:hypothetical protein
VRHNVNCHESLVLLHRISSAHNTVFLHSMCSRLTLVNHTHKIAIEHDEHELVSVVYKGPHVPKVLLNSLPLLRHLCHLQAESSACTDPLIVGFSYLFIHAAHAYGTVQSTLPHETTAQKVVSATLRLSSIHGCSSSSILQAAVAWKPIYPTRPEQSTKEA